MTDAASATVMTARTVVQRMGGGVAGRWNACSIVQGMPSRYTPWSPDGMPEKTFNNGQQSMRRLNTGCGVHQSVQAILVLALLVGPWAARGQDAAEVRKDVKPDNAFGVDYSGVGFEDGQDPWHLVSLSLSRRSVQRSLIGRVNYAHRFGISGGQLELDAYPKLSTKIYAYLNVGYSPSSIFPTWRSGGELFFALPKAWETSVGYRQLRFAGVPITLLTAAVGKYAGNYWFSIRPFVRQTDVGISASATVTARRYFEDGDHYLGARIGYGRTPPDQGTPDPQSLARTHALSANIHGAGDIRSGLLGTWSLGYDREELEQSHVRKSWTATAGLRFQL